ncbi:baseplate protein (plasmid) [Raoultella ornithinolytica]|uniref:baseplate protein n=1 Tax=Raoultella ornithinolytica TaxID=54291 RepID=UPI00292BD810|nr:baseplate protein [Raoultella ornithinolytica]MDV1094958.1 baseplate protein [Raoultella ornithinolytica]MDV1122698.1 baseplate protein [Raoultella ornithinolytica]MDV1893213.1 baseplate protein [Raoultella ornithinolytica]
MSGFANTKADTAFLKARFNKNLAAGEKLVGAEFWMTIKGFENLSVLVRTTQIPEMTREDVEDYTPGGMKMNQHGPLRNSGEFQVTCAETIEGTVLSAVKDLVYGKKYVEVELQAAAESNSGEHKGLIRTFSHCKIYSDAVDFSAEDVTAVVRPTLRIVYNWVE